jgi:hypothetical protein
MEKGVKVQHEGRPRKKLEHETALYHINTMREDSEEGKKPKGKRSNK